MTFDVGWEFDVGGCGYAGGGSVFETDLTPFMNAVSGLPNDFTAHDFSGVGGWPDLFADGDIAMPVFWLWALVAFAGSIGAVGFAPNPYRSSGVYRPGGYTLPAIAGVSQSAEAAPAAAPYRAGRKKARDDEEAQDAVNEAVKETAQQADVQRERGNVGKEVGKKSQKKPEAGTPAPAPSTPESPTEPASPSEAMERAYAELSAEIVGKGGVRVEMEARQYVITLTMPMDEYVADVLLKAKISALRSTVNGTGWKVVGPAASYAASDAFVGPPAPPAAPLPSSEP